MLPIADVHARHAAEMCERACAAWADTWRLWREIESEGADRRRCQVENWDSVLVALAVLLRAGRPALDWRIRATPTYAVRFRVRPGGAPRWLEGRERGAYRRALVVDIQPVLRGEGAALVEWRAKGGASHPAGARAPGDVLPGSTTDLLVQTYLRALASGRVAAHPVAVSPPQPRAVA